MISRHVKRDGFACRDEGQRAKPLGSRMVKVNALRELQSASGDASRVASALWGRGRMGESERHVEGLFESLLAEVFDD